MQAYTFKLGEVTETKAAIVVSKGAAGVGTGYVRGSVAIGPICPVERVDEPCVIPPEAYTSRSVVIFNAAGTEVTRQALETDGTYQLALPQGTYTLQIQPAGIGAGEKQVVTVVAGKTQTVDFDIDTGIR